MNSLRTIVLIDGQNLYRTAKTLGFDIDFKKLLTELASFGNVIRTKYYTCIDEDDEESSVIPLVDWLSYNGYSVVTKSVRAFTDSEGRSRRRGKIDVELAVDAMGLAPYVDEVVLVSGNGDFSVLMSTLQRQGKRCTVISSVVSDPPMCADTLRRQADEFIDLAKLRSKISRDSFPRSERKPVNFGASQ